MELSITTPDQTLPIHRAFIVNIVIKSFKGRKNVEVHLYRPQWDKAEEQSYPWDRLLVQPPSQTKDKVDKSRQVILESFTEAERDQLIDYLKERYQDRLTLINSAFLSFPVPAGLMPLSMMPENENFGRIRFELIPNYSLDFQVHGFYDLGAHAPILTGEEL
ncbi:hypothetical protein [Desulfonatronovibrio magnus]|uniref:hypothetical protein n=1 Tax=Desulfonatronovibrio magnus TaxID=698827 RepID=UPI0005EBBE31|nr:hypothetical protein [Desulfonatronovibrio magnus]